MWLIYTLFLFLSFYHYYAHSKCINEWWSHLNPAHLLLSDYTLFPGRKKKKKDGTTSLMPALPLLDKTSRNKRNVPQTVSIKGTLLWCQWKSIYLCYRKWLSLNVENVVNYIFGGPKQHYERARFCLRALCFIYCTSALKHHSTNMTDSYQCITYVSICQSWLREQSHKEPKPTKLNEITWMKRKTGFLFFHLRLSLHPPPCHPLSSSIQCNEDTPSCLPPPTSTPPFSVHPPSHSSVLVSLTPLFFLFLKCLLKLWGLLLTPSSSTQPAHSVLWDELWLIRSLPPSPVTYLPFCSSLRVSFSLLSLV